MQQLLATNIAPQKLDSYLAAGGMIFQHFQRGERVSTHKLKIILTTCFGGSDADGLWVWKDAYECIEIALVKYIISNHFKYAINIVRRSLTRKKQQK